MNKINQLFESLYLFNILILIMDKFEIKLPKELWIKILEYANAKERLEEIRNESSRTLELSLGYLRPAH